MDIHCYLSLMPEALIASMLPPVDFGQYLAVGTEKRARGKAMFFDLACGFQSDFFDFASLPERCVPHPDGRPKHSVYLGVYRVMEHVPLDVLRSLWLVTQDGRVLELGRAETPSTFPGKYHLYQEICPVHPLIASRLNPVEFCRFITDPARPIHVPKICFVDLELSELADDPRCGRPLALPYHNIEHIRDCLMEMEQKEDKHTKTVDRTHSESFPYRCIKTGFFVGDHDAALYYPLPPREELETTHYDWWRSANV